MGTTNSTKKELNKYIVPKDSINSQGRALFTDITVVNTGNQEDSEGKVVNNKYVSGKVKNMTYTLENNEDGTYEETARVLNYSDPIHTDASITTVYWHPDKWVFDAHQNYNNCGVVSALNVLSMAGKIDVVAPTDAEVEEMTAEITVTKYDRYGRAYEAKVKPNVDFSSTEDKLTLEAIRKNYCNHSLNISQYNSIKDLLS